MIKAPCSPINTYGACKFVSEKIFTNYDKETTKTAFVVARLSNILESTGSIIPIFMNKIKQGEEIPLTDDRMTRFIINKTTTVEVLFDAIRYCIGGEIFVRQSPALKIIDLIEVLKKKLNKTNAIKLIGLRPGEKIHETLVNQAEIARLINFDNYYIIRPSVDSGTDRYAKALYAKDFQEAKPLTQEYSSDQTVVSQEALTRILEQLNIF